MDTASLGGFLRTLFIIVLCYYAFRFAMRYLFPLFVYKAAKKASENFQQRQQDFYNQQNSSQNQNTQQDSFEADRPKEKKKVGEYIDFEEID